MHLKNTITILLICLLSNLLHSQTTVTIGSGIVSGGGTQDKPFGMWYGYERSAALYPYAEIGGYGFITSLAWEVGVADFETCPTKIYLKLTSSTTLSSATWTSMTSGATLVYDGTTTFPALGWQTVNVADFAYSANNLLVLVETNYGINGGTSYPEFNYNYYLNTHESWSANTSPPSIGGAVDNNRPNIQMSWYTPLGNPVPPSGFMATASSSSQVNLAWKKNTAGDNVMVAFNTVNTFGVPTGTYSAGDNIAGGGTVIYNGSALLYNQATGLSPATIYYYKAWSFHTSGSTYSAGASSSASTLCDPSASFPLVADFESTSFPPQCWSLSSKTWFLSTSASGYGNGTSSAKADFKNIPSGNFDLVSPKLDLSTLSGSTVSFDHAYATESGKVDRLDLYYSTNGGTSYTLLTSYSGGPSGPLNTGGSTTSPFVPTAAQWATKSFALPVGTNKVKFRGVSAYGNNLYLDNITFTGTCLPPTSLAASNQTSTSADLSWTPVGLTSLWDVKWGDAGFNPASAGTLVSGVTSSTYSLQGLDPNHAYAFYARSDCGGILSTWTGPFNFSTDCGTATAPYSENLDTYVAPATGCISVTDNNTDGTHWVTSVAHPRSAPNSMYLSTNTSVASEDWFYSPALDLADGTTYELDFYYRSSGSAAEQLEVRWGASPDAGMTSSLWNNTNINTATYTRATIFLTPPAPDTYFIGWRCYSAKNKQYLCVDDIAISEVTSVTWNGSVSVSWNNPLNWSPAIIPAGSMDVVIPGSPASGRFPVVSVSGPTCRDLLLNPNASLTINTGMIISIGGNLTISQGSTLNNQGSVILQGNLDNLNP